MLLPPSQVKPDIDLSLLFPEKEVNKPSRADKTLKIGLLQKKGWPPSAATLAG